MRVGRTTPACRLAGRCRVKGAEVESAFEAIRRVGLVPRGAFRLGESERRGPLAGVRTIVLAGMAGRDGWSAFAASPEASDGLGDPLDRWSRRVIESSGARTRRDRRCFPFGGPPCLAVPAMGAARRAGPSLADRSSDPSRATGFGTPIAARLGFREALAVPEPEALPSPCESCSGRWCLKACPVGAFSAAGYDVAACVGHVKSAAGADCMERGLPGAPRLPGRGGTRLSRPNRRISTMRAFIKGQGGA